ncbi:MAG: homoserine O-acetyltransferase, partial [Actinobacteria bacterium]|nr:homoserine O-acetyltransferase [Actinomycetota bacterium]
RGGLREALDRISVPTLIMGISSDTLYPTYQQRQLCELLSEGGCASEYVEIGSRHGHDGFLLELDQVGAALSPFLASVDKAEHR